MALEIKVVMSKVVFSVAKRGQGQKSNQLIWPKMLWRGARGFCGHRSKKLVALAQHGVARAQTLFAQAQVTLGSLLALRPKHLLHLLHPRNTTFLGRDMGGCKTYGGRKTYQTMRSPENFWTPPKELLVCSVVDSCTGKTEH